MFRIHIRIRLPLLPSATDPFHILIMTIDTEAPAPESEVALVGDVLRVRKRSFPLSDEEGIRRFVEREVEFWKWLTAANNYSFRHEFEEFRQLDSIISLPSYHYYEAGEATRHMAERLVRLYSTGRLPLSSSPQAQFVKSIAVKDKELAAHVLSELLGKKERADSHKVMQAVVIAALFKRGIRKNVDSERASLQQLRGEWDESLDEVKADYQRVRGNFELQHQETVTRIAALEEHAREYIAELGAEVAHEKEQRAIRAAAFDEEVAGYREAGAEAAESILESVAAAKQELEHLTAAYNAHMSLKAPVAYWQENEALHRTSARAHLRTLGFVAPVAIVALAALGWFLLGDGENPPLGHMVLFFMFAGLVVWFLRVLTRLYLSHKHLEVDASERVVAAKTYLALLKDGHEAIDAERTIIIGTLFRPAAIGIINDDAMPASSVELVGRLLKGEK